MTAEITDDMANDGSGFGFGALFICFYDPTGLQSNIFASASSFDLTSDDEFNGT